MRGADGLMTAQDGICATRSPATTRESGNAPGDRLTDASCLGCSRSAIL